MSVERVAAASAAVRRRAASRTAPSSGNSRTRSDMLGAARRTVRRTGAGGRTTGTPRRTAPRRARARPTAWVWETKTTMALGWVRMTARASERRRPTSWVLQMRPRPRTSKGSTAAQTTDPRECRRRSTRGSRRGVECSSIGFRVKSEVLAGAPAARSRSTRHGCGGSGRQGRRGCGRGRAR